MTACITGGILGVGILEGIKQVGMAAHSRPGGWGWDVVAAGSVWVYSSDWTGLPLPCLCEVCTACPLFSALLLV